MAILLPHGAGAVKWLGGDVLAVLGSGNEPGIDKRPGIVTPIILGHVTTTTEEEGRVVVVF